MAPAGSRWFTKLYTPEAASPAGLEGPDDVADRKMLLRRFGYKL